MTYNIGGGRKDFASSNEAILQKIRSIMPDILCVQECSNWIDGNGEETKLSEQIAIAGEFKQNYYFGKTLSLSDNFHPRKTIMVHGLFNDWVEWEQGNAVFTKYGITKLSNPQVDGRAHNIPLYRPLAYRGTRDTDPRFAILARTKYPPVNPYIVGVHLTTLLGERGGSARELPGKSEEAEIMRLQQSQRLIQLLAPKIKEKAFIILLGDFNATSSENCVASILEGEGHFERLKPKKEIPTHPKVNKAVDHIFIYSGDRDFEYSCWIDDSDSPSIAPSDHLPVIADLSFN